MGCPIWGVSGGCPIGRVLGGVSNRGPPAPSPVAGQGVAAAQEVPVQSGRGRLRARRMREGLEQPLGGARLARAPEQRPPAGRRTRRHQLPQQRPGGDTRGVKGVTRGPGGTQVEYGGQGVPCGQGMEGPVGWDGPGGHPCVGPRCIPWVGVPWGRPRYGSQVKGVAWEDPRCGRRWGVAGDAPEWSWVGLQRESQGFPGVGVPWAGVRPVLTAG